VICDKATMLTHTQTNTVIQSHQTNSNHNFTQILLIKIQILLAVP